MAAQFMKDVNIIDKGAYEMDLRVRVDTVSDCRDCEECPPGECMLYRTYYITARIKTFFRYPKTGAEFNKNRTKDDQGKFEDDEPVDMPAPTFENQRPPAGSTIEEIREHWKTRAREFKYIRGPKKLGCRKKSAWEKYQKSKNTKAVPNPIPGFEGAGIPRFENGEEKK